MKFSKMIRESRKGNEQAIAELESYLKRTVPLANKNLSALERADLTQYAYARASIYLESERDTNRFSAAIKGRSTDELIAEAEELHTFMGSKTHTVSGAQSAFDKQMSGLERLRELGYENVPTDKEKLKVINRVLGNDGLKLSGAERYAVFDKIAEAIDTTDLVEEDMTFIVDRYASGEITYGKMLSDFERSHTSISDEIEHGYFSTILGGFE